MVLMSNSKEENMALAFSNSFLEEGKIELRKYQIDIASQCITKNSLVVIPTGLGKTVIAILIAAKTLEISPPNSKIIVMAPTRPLINQHLESFMKFLSIPDVQYAILTGKIPPEKRPEEFESHQMLFFTPQTLRNDLVAGRYNLKSCCLLIFDEAHHASGDYPYAMISDLYVEHNPDGTTLALTASPGSSQQDINDLCMNLHIPSKNIHIRVRKDEDVKNYIKPMDIYKIGVNLTSLMEDVRKILHIVLEERLRYLSQMGFLEVKCEKLYEKIIRKDLLELNRKLLAIIQGDGDKTGAYKALSINAQGLILFHMLELVEQQGLDVLLKYLQKLQKDARKKSSSKANRILAADSRLRRVHLELKKQHEFDPNSLLHPKLKILRSVLLDEFSKKEDSKILVFVKLRASVKNIVKRLKPHSQIRPVRFVGQATKSDEDKGLSQNQQIKILEQFKEGMYNVLVSTNVGEEGLDIAECDLVIFYDVVASEIRLIQRRGRTARHREGRVIILYCRDTNDEVYLRIAMNKLKRMQKNLKKPQKNKSPSKSLNDSNFTRFTFKKDSDMENQVKVSTYERQSSLEDFTTKRKQEAYLTKLEEQKQNQKDKDIILSSHLNMKYGLRKLLKNAEINFSIRKMDHSITLFGKICIEIRNPRKFTDSDISNLHRNLTRKFELVVIVMDFIGFREDFEEEKRLLRHKLTEFGKDNSIQIVNVDNSEEVFYLVKNIYEYNKK
ncbi:MAG: DEAD/DEAH box helicase [Candidatus Lokiarchaeota archaeon]|nr:DEAD/DEAH box helicase [Candidatus Lokiarchaeota archaeon]